MHVRPPSSITLILETCYTEQVSDSLHSTCSMWNNIFWWLRCGDRDVLVSPIAPVNNATQSILEAYYSDVLVSPIAPVDNATPSILEAYYSDVLVSPIAPVNNATPSIPCFSGCLQLGNELQKQSRDQTQPADWSVWSRDRFCKLQAT